MILGDFTTLALYLNVAKTSTVLLADQKVGTPQ